MDWNDQQIRGAGYVVEILAVSWRGASLTALRIKPLSPPELLAIFEAAQASNTPVFGPHAIYMECVKRHLAVLARGGLVEVGPLEGGRRRYLLTPVARAMLDALEPTADYGVRVYDWLVDVGRATRKISTSESARNFSPPIPGMPSSERLRRRSLALIFARLLAQRWSFTILAMLAGGAVRFSLLIERADQILQVADPFASASRLGRSTLTSRLDYLRSVGLVDQVDDSAHRNPARPPGSREVAYVLTDAGRALLAALEAVAAFGVEHDAALLYAVRALTP
jgi:DNA-binding HxlR family transcriptional regulator